MGIINGRIILALVCLHLQTYQYNPILLGLSMRLDKQAKEVRYDHTPITLEIARCIILAVRKKMNVLGLPE